MEALLSMVEHVSIYKAITTVYEGGLSHKSVVVRTHVAMLVDHVITALGPEKFYGSSKDTQVQFILHTCLGLCGSHFMPKRNLEFLGTTNPHKLK